MLLYNFASMGCLSDWNNWNTLMKNRKGIHSNLETKKMNYTKPILSSATGCGHRN
jgi:hypothetical protein